MVDDNAPHKAPVLALPKDLARRLDRQCGGRPADRDAFCLAAIEAALRNATRRRDAPPPIDQTAQRRRDYGRRVLARALEGATTWAGLLEALKAEDFALAPAGGGLEVRRASSGERLCKLSEIGPGYKALIQRFQAPFPGHPHRWLAEEALGAPSAPRRRAAVIRADLDSMPRDELLDFGEDARRNPAQRP